MTTVVLGVDPGYASCGWALVAFAGQSRRIIDAGAWTTGAEFDIPTRVAMIASCFRWRLEKSAPVTAVAIEAFTHQRGQANATVMMGVTRVIDRLRVVAEEAGLPVYEITTSQAKAALGLSGRVPKERVRKMVATLFGTRIESSHAADAVAVAVAGAGERRWRAEMRRTTDAKGTVAG